VETRQAIRSFILDREARNISRRTVQFYEQKLGEFCARYPQVPEAPDPIREFLRDLTCGDETRHGYFRALRALYNFLELKELGYKGSYNQMKRAVRPWREERRWLEEATVRFETLPGQQAQIDWASAWAWIGEERRRVQLFTMVLGYSRCLYGEFTEDEKLPTLLRCHEHAFDWFGGSP